MSPAQAGAVLVALNVAAGALWLRDWWRDKVRDHERRWQAALNADACPDFVEPPAERLPLLDEAELVAAMADPAFGPDDIAWPGGER